MSSQSSSPGWVAVIVFGLTYNRPPQSLKPKLAHRGLGPTAFKTLAGLGSVP